MIAAIRSFASVLGGSRRLVVLTSVLALLQSALTIPIGLLFKRVFDHTIPGGHSGELVAVCGLLIVLGLAAAGLALYIRHLVLGVTKDGVRRLRAALLERVQTLPASWTDHQDSGFLHAVIVQDTDRIEIVLNAAAAQLLPATIIAIGLGAAMLVVNPILFLVLLPVVPIMTLVTRAIEGVLICRTRAWHQAFDRFSIRTHFLLWARLLITTHGTEESELGAAREELVEVRDTSRSMAWLTAAYSQAASAITMVAAVLVLLVGGLAVIDKDASIGSLISFYALAALVRGQLSTIVSAVPELLTGGESLTRINALLQTDEPQPYHGTRQPQAVLPITVRNVHFSYPGGAPVLRGADLEIAGGELVAITGANGAGKTTLAALIIGIYGPRSGSLSAAGVPFEELDMRALRRRLAVVDQNPILFSGTVAQNIGYGSPSATAADIARAAHTATVDAFIDQLPQGYETLVGDEGVLLSGGQRQRIAIARALLRSPELLILDEPTASLDQPSIGTLLSNLREGPRARGILAISHQPDVIAAADRVYFLSDGILSQKSPPLVGLRRENT